MEYKETLCLKSGRPIERKFLIKLSSQLQQQGIEVGFINSDMDFLDKCKSLIIEKGTTYILSIEHIKEEVLLKTEDRKDLLVEILNKQLEKLSPSKDLTVVDRYFLSTKPSDRTDYLRIFKEIFGTIISKIAEIRFITDTTYNQTLYGDIKQILIDLNPNISVKHSTSSDFHDRFWIADEKKGLFVGTSLNGIGIRYALTDFMRDEDTTVIVGELKKLHLI